MARVFARPEDLERFAAELQRFNAQLAERMRRLNAQFVRLGDTWRDQEHQQFASTFTQTMLVLQRFRRTADLHIVLLRRKAQQLRAYLATSGPVAQGNTTALSSLTPGGTPATPPSVEEEALTTPGKWVDHGLIEVRVADLPDPEGVHGPEDFHHHLSWEDAVYHARRLPQIMREVKAGKTLDDFRREDEAQGIYDTRGKSGTYELFYSQTDPITLEKIGARYFIVSGRHRIFVAKALGLETIPARVIEKVPSAASQGDASVA